ncbi:hypothetical protein C8A05DRAFT_30462 [Staphylotrichum tortipilum]|uniref:Aromatic-L-amino-acid decarboxylase n=1 Tax=Staphylotrichum tortipilum TaxID=2831512 RepID=A0AAN6MSQ4_9PEZI|nr:hypothetical protein C8A05DRAFT_30462 [Staphylotrichum longicolle]
MDSQVFREAATATIEEIITYFDTLAARDVVSSVQPGYLRTLLPTEVPQDGEPWSAIHADMDTKILPGITHWTHPNFHAFFPCATSYPSLLGELYSGALSGACFNWVCSPAVTELETIVLDWLAKALGLPDCFLSTGPTRGGGVIHGSASEGVLTAMVAARERFLRGKVPGWEGEYAGEDAEVEEVVMRARAGMVALGTGMTHSSARKAARVLGVRFRAIPVRAEDGYALTREGLAAALAECRAQGLQPFFLVATLGTTDVCSVDDFAGISAALEADPDGERVWVHVDAAYAGAALVCPEVQASTRIALAARFHSFTVNMHKWLLTNFDASCFFVRDREWLVRALGVSQAVYGNAASDGGLVTDYREWQIPLGRRFRSLKIWFVLRTYGIKGLQEYVRRGMRMGVRVAEALRARSDLFEIVAGPIFALTVFRAAGERGGAALTLEERNALTREVYEKVNATGKIWLTSTELDGRFAIRLMTAVRTTQEDHVDRAMKTIVEVAERVMKG